MEKHPNILKTIIDMAYKESKPRKLNQIISLIYGRADFRQGILSKADLEKLNKLSRSAEDISTLFSIGLVYNYIFAFHLANVDHYDPDFVLSIVNILFPLYEKLSDTILSRRLLVHLKKLLLNLLKRSELQSQDKSQIHSLLENPNIRMDNVLSNFDENSLVKEIKQLLRSKNAIAKVTAVTHLMNLITDCSNLEEQLNVFYKKSLNIFKTGGINAADHPRDLIYLLGYLVDHMFFQCEYLLKIQRQVFEPERDVSENPALFLNFETEPIIIKNKERVGGEEIIDPNYFIASYRLAEPESILKLSENIYTILAFFINTFLLYPNQIDIQRLSITLLQRLYYNFPKFRKNVEDAIMTILSFINQDSLDSNKKEASIFLYKLINRDASPEFKQNLESKESFKSLYETSYYRPCVLNKSENAFECRTLRDLNIKAGFPEIKSIPAGQVHTIYVEIWKPYSVLYWAFAIPDYDIVFSVVQVSSFGKAIRGHTSDATTIYKEKKIEASKHQYKGSYIAKDAGLYKLTFDNSSSWWNAKTIKFVVHVLEPEIDVGITVPGQEHLIIANAKKAELEEDETKVEYERSSRKSSRMYESQELMEATALIHLDKYNINLKVGNKLKSYESQFSYPTTQQEWETVNKEMFQTVKKGIKKEESQSDNNFIVKFVYSKDALENKAFENVEPTKANLIKKMASVFSFLDTLEERIVDDIEVIPETDFVTDELLRESRQSKHDDNNFVLCINNALKEFSGKHKRQSKEFRGQNLNEICVPLYKDGDVHMEEVSTLYFSEESGEKKLYYLASLLMNIFVFYGEKLKSIVIFEDKAEENLMENQDKVKEIFQSYITKRRQQRKDLEDNENEGEEVPSLEFRRVRVEEYLKL